VKIETKFNIRQEVFIPAFGNHKARISVIKASGEPNVNLWYELEYWTETELKVVTLSEPEIISKIPTKEAGFHAH
jgi:hypothetical protein